MINRLLKDLLFASMPSQYAKGHTLNLRKVNASRLFLFSLFGSVAQVLMLVLNIVLNTDSFANDSLTVLWLVQLAYLVVCACIFYYFLKKDVATKTLMGLCNYYFVVIFALFQVLIVRNEYSLESTLYTYAFGALIVGLIPIFDMFESFSLIATYTVIMILQLLSKQESLNVYSLIFMLGISTIALVFSRILHVQFIRNYVNEKNLIEKTDQIELKAGRYEVLSMTDQLTSINNRRGFEKLFKSYWEKCLEERKYIAVMMLDIDRFKQYNDTYGHPQGDKCLIVVANTLKEAFLRKTDLFARFGGEEFIASMSFSDIGRSAKQAERLRLLMEKNRLPHESSDIEKYVTISIGVAGMVPTKGDTPEKLILMADAALYHSKNTGRNKVTIYDETMPLGKPR